MSWLKRLICRSVWVSVAYLAMAFMSISPAQAVGIITPFGGVSLIVLIPITPPPFPIFIFVDPPGVQSLDFEFSYDPGLFDYVDSGFLCDFSIGGSCPATIAGTGTMSFVPASSSDLVFGTALPGTSASILVDPAAGTIDLSYDLSASPPATGADRYAFGIELQPLVQLTGLATYQTLPGAYDFTVNSTTCTAIDGSGSVGCGSNTPSSGIQFGIPEPATSSLLAIGVLALGILACLTPAGPAAKW